MVLNHLKEKDILDNCLPSSIVIGPFYINVNNVKKSLSKKLKALATSMLDILAKNLHKEVDSVSAHSARTLTHSRLLRCPRQGRVSAGLGQWKEPYVAQHWSLLTREELSHVGGAASFP